MGFSAMVCTPTLAKSLRGSIVKGLGIRKAGGCVGTALAMFGYATRDPLVTFSIEHVTHFLEALKGSPKHMTMAIQAVWPLMLTRLERKHRWMAVNGPLSAAIATLLDRGSQPVDYNLWIDPDS